MCAGPCTHLKKKVRSAVSRGLSTTSDEGSRSMEYRSSTSLEGEGLNQTGTLPRLTTWTNRVELWPFWTPPKLTTRLEGSATCGCECGWVGVGSEKQRGRV